MTGADSEPIDGYVAAPVSTEFPSLALRYHLLEADTGRSPKYIREQLRHLSNRIFGERAVNLRREPIAHAYRVFFRHIGLDPDQVRTPVEAVIVERLRAGRFASSGRLVDALTIAIVETGVALRALDSATIAGQLGLRVSNEGERLAGDRSEPQLPAGTIVIADQGKALAPIFGELAESVLPSRSTTHVALCAIKAEGVPNIAVDEALWKCATLLDEGD